MKNKLTKMHLECILTDTEKLNYSKEMAENVSAKARAEDSLQSFSKQKKAEIAGFETKINLVADKLNSGKEYREVECEIAFNLKENQKKTIRLDTGVVVRTEELTLEDLQGNLPLETK